MNKKHLHIIKTRNYIYTILFVIAVLLISISEISLAYNYVEVLPQAWQEAEAHDINNNGTVVGSGKDNNNISKGFIYHNGTYTTLIPPDWEEAYAHGINNQGDVVGHGLVEYYKGFLYSNGIYTEVLPPGWKESYAYAINDNGAIVGYGRHKNYYKGFLFHKGLYAEILPPGWKEAFTFGINNSNTVVGYGRDESGKNKGFIFSGGTYKELLPPGWAEAKAIDINDKGNVVGHGIKGSYSSFLYSKGQYSELSAPGLQFIEVYGINNNNDIVGRLIYKDGNMRGFIYTGTSIAVLLPPRWSWSQVYAINSNGAVIGYGTYSSKKSGFIASGTPEISVSPLTIFFGGNIRDGSIPDKTVTVKNTGTAELEIGTVTSPASSYIIIGDDCSERVLGPSITCEITYSFIPSSKKPLVASSYIPSNDTQQSIVTITVGVFPDYDNDGYTLDVDCDDTDPLMNPGITEIPHNDKDDDCDHVTKDR